MTYYGPEVVTLRGQTHRGGQALRRLRIRAGLRQSELAEKAGLSKQFICDLEHGKSRPSGDSIVRLAYALQVDAGDLLTLWYGPEPRRSGRRSEAVRS